MVIRKRNGYFSSTQNLFYKEPKIVKTHVFFILIFHFMSSLFNFLQAIAKHNFNEIFDNEFVENKLVH